MINIYLLRGEVVVAEESESKKELFLKKGKRPWSIKWGKW